MLKQQLNIKLQQRLSPSQIQVMKLLEYPTLELEQKIADELMDNPALEIAPEEMKDTDETDDFCQPDSLTPDADWAWNDDNDDTPDDIPEYRLKTSNRSVNDSIYTAEQSSVVDLTDNLTEQINVLDLTDQERDLCRYIIGNIDSDGYLRRDIERLVDDIAVLTGKIVNDADMEKALAIVQTLEPVGIGARNLQECILIQLRSKTNKTDIDRIAENIVDRHFDLLAKKQTDNLQLLLDISHDTLEKAFEVIQHLNPNPAINFESGYSATSQTIIPDFIVENINGRLDISLNNSNIPELRINDEYNQMMREYNSTSNNQTIQQREALLFAKQKADAARWFIDAIALRNSTMMATIKAIVQIQYNFFVSGDEKQLRPMRLKDISDITDINISTISRVSNSKYVDTEWGIYPLKRFFSDGVITDEGEMVSKNEVKKFIVETIKNEDKTNPITDDELTRLVQEKGFKISRRTVAKYRTALEIPIAQNRRQ